jgi:hypothetical protein
MKTFRLETPLYFVRASHGQEECAHDHPGALGLPRGTIMVHVGPSKVPGHEVVRSVRDGIYIRIPSVSLNIIIR